MFKCEGRGLPSIVNDYEISLNFQFMLRLIKYLIKVFEIHYKMKELSSKI